MHDGNKLFPLLLTLGSDRANSTKESLSEKLSELYRSLRPLYEDTTAYYKKFAAEHVSIETPDKQFDEAFKWAEISIDQLKVETTRSHQETALVAGFYGSGDSARPGLAGTSVVMLCGLFTR